MPTENGPATLVQLADFPDTEQLPIDFPSTKISILLRPTSSFALAVKMKDFCANAAGDSKRKDTTTAEAKIATMKLILTDKVCIQS